MLLKVGWFFFFFQPTAIKFSWFITIMGIAVIQMYFKHAEMKMALTVAVNVCLVLHCMAMIMQKVHRRLVIIQVQACLSGRSVYKVILEVVLSLPAVGSLGNFSPNHDISASRLLTMWQRSLSPFYRWGIEEKRDWVASQGNTWHVWQEWMLDTADAVLSQNLSSKHSSFPKEMKFSLRRPNDFQYFVSSCCPKNANCNN